MWSRASGIRCNHGLPTGVHSPRGGTSQGSPATGHSAHRGASGRTSCLALTASLHTSQATVACSCPTKPQLGSNQRTPRQEIPGECQQAARVACAFCKPSVCVCVCVCAWATKQPGGLFCPMFPDLRLLRVLGSLTPEHLKPGHFVLWEGAVPRVCVRIESSLAREASSAPGLGFPWVPNPLCYVTVEMSST